MHTQSMWNLSKSVETQTNSYLVVSIIWSINRSLNAWCVGLSSQRASGLSCAIIFMLYWKIWDSFSFGHYFLCKNNVVLKNSGYLILSPNMVSSEEKIFNKV
jgi:hypothetical protein